MAKEGCRWGSKAPQGKAMEMEDTGCGEKMKSRETEMKNDSKENSDTGERRKKRGKIRWREKIREYDGRMKVRKTKKRSRGNEKMEERERN